MSDDFVEYIDKMVRYDFRQRYRNAEQALTVLQTLKPLAPQPTTIIVTQPDAALPSPNESKTIEPTQVTIPQPDLPSTEPLVSASSSTIITTSESNPDSTASTIVTQPNIEYETSTLEQEQSIKPTHRLESTQDSQVTTEPTLSFLIPQTIEVQPNFENAVSLIESAKSVAQNQVNNSNHGGQPTDKIEVTSKSSQLNQDLQVKVNSKKLQKILLSLVLVGTVAATAIVVTPRVVYLIQAGSFEYSSSQQASLDKIVGEYHRFNHPDNVFNGKLEDKSEEYKLTINSEGIFERYSKGVFDFKDLGLDPYEYRSTGKVNIKDGKVFFLPEMVNGKKASEDTIRSYGNIGYILSADGRVLYDNVSGKVKEKFIRK